MKLNHVLRKDQCNAEHIFTVKILKIRPLLAPEVLQIKGGDSKWLEYVFSLKIQLPNKIVKVVIDRGL